MLVPGDGIDVQVQLVQHLQHPDMRRAARTASGQHQPMRGRVASGAAGAAPGSGALHVEPASSSPARMSAVRRMLGDAHLARD